MKAYPRSSRALVLRRAPDQEPGSTARVVRDMTLTTFVGLIAAFCTTVSYFPQLKKCWETGSAGDLSLKMF